MNVSRLRFLRCPFCAGDLNPSGTNRAEGELDYAVLACHCGRFPVIAGIPVLKKGPIGSAGQRATTVIALIESGRHREALLAMITPPSPASPGLAPAWLRRLPSVKGIGFLKRLSHQRALGKWRDETAMLMPDAESQVRASAFSDFYYSRMGPKALGARDYFVFRFGQPRHLVALSLAGIISRPTKPLLDLACGWGHITRALVQRANNQPVFGTDTNFIGLYGAKYWVAPEADYICCEADASLPFADGGLSAVICSDAFHYFGNKVTTIRELRRLTQEDGIIILVTVRNALVEYAVSGQALRPDGYAALFAGMPCSLVPNSAVLACYLQKQGPPLARSYELAELAHESALSLVASHRREVFRDYGTFESWPHAEGRLALNPLYTEERQDGPGKVHLRRTFPTAWYEEDNAECKQYLPETVSVNSGILSALAEGRRPPEVEKLIEQYVVLGLPDRYR